MLSFWSMCLFRNSPALLPKSHLFFGLTVAIYFFLTLALSRNLYSFFAQVFPEVQIAKIDLQRDIVNVALGLILDYALIYVVMRTFNFQSRTFQTIFALFGTGIVFTAFMLIGAAIGISAPVVWVLALAGVGIWSLLVSGYILGLAMEMSLFKGVLIIIAIYFVKTFVVMLVFGSPDGATNPATQGS